MSLLALPNPASSAAPYLTASVLVTPPLCTCPDEATDPALSGASSASSTVSAPRHRAHVARNLALAGLLLLPFDTKTMPRIQRAVGTDRGNGAIDLVNNFGTPQVLLPVIGALYLSPAHYDHTSAAMAGVAFVDAGFLVEVGKTLTGRARPDTPGVASGAFTGPTLKSSYASFPSGHTAVAFAVATVLAHRYPKHRWLYYGVASAVGVARVWKSAHFPSDVLVGAGVGYCAGDSAVQSRGRLLSFTW